MTDYFPGSSHPLPLTHRGLRPNYPLSVGKMYKIGGRDVELFSIGELAQILNRKPATIRKWERDGILPKATFVKPGAGGDLRGKRRLYSRAQVEAVVAIAASEGILSNLTGNISKTKFSQRVHEAFKKLAGKR